MPADDPAIAREDRIGRTPGDVVLLLIDAKNRRDWRAAYSMYASPEVDFDTAVREWSEADERHEDSVARETRVIDDANALVRLTYRATTTPPGGDPYPIVIEEPGEWWAVSKVDGVWKVDWLPRQ